ncbi:MAG: Hsp20/alpha crystallin family protein [Chloroflexi bacterium]|nr:Hsp20/alpha crystallin family protein [Chloroflexota bacterium]
MTAITIRRMPSRALTTVEPAFRSAWSALEDVEHLARHMWESWTPTVSQAGWCPRFDLYEIKDELVIKADLPGMKREDIDISMENDYLTIKGERKVEELPEDTKYYTCERYFGSFSRELFLPFPVSADKISATFENGSLEIRLPKAEEAKAKRIEIKVK